MNRVMKKSLLLLFLMTGYVNSMIAYTKQKNVGDVRFDLDRTSILKEANFTKGMSFCGRFRYWRLGIYSTMFEFGSGNRIIRSVMGYRTTKLEFSSANWIVKDLQKGSFKLWTALKWHHICFAFDRQNSHVLYVTDGQATNINMVLKPEINTDFISSKLLDEIKFAGRSVYGFSAHSGTITDIHMWDFPLTEVQMKEWTMCKPPQDMTGNVVDWSTASWILMNMKEEVVETREALCNATHLGPKLIGTSLPASSSLTLCHQLRGKMFVISSQTDLELAKILNWNETWKGVWNGWWDEPQENNFTDVNQEGLVLDQNQFSGSIWALSDPNGDETENCGVVKNDKFWDVSCEEENRAVCDIEEVPTFLIRGLCEETAFDTDYGWRNRMAHYRYPLVGFGTSEISWDNDKKQWKMKSNWNSNITATTVGGTTGYPLGLLEWNFKNDHCGNHGVNQTDGSYNMVISVSACIDDTYNCGDGTCIHIKKRCDGKMDCADRSDEQNCSKIQVDKESYLKSYPPSSDEKLDILCHIDILNVLDIDEVSAKMTVQLQLTLEWIEPRIDYLNLKADERDNGLSQEETTDLWMPILVFSNTKIKQQANFANKSSEAFVKINDGAKRHEFPIQELHNGHKHLGKDCTIVVMDYFTVDFIYSFQMSYYPFDNQAFTGTIVPRKDDSPYVRLIPGNLSYSGAIDLMKYMVRSSQFKKDSANDASLEFEIILGRQILSEVLTSILPTIIIVAVSFSTNYYGPDHFEAIVTVNLTALLVMATLFISVFTSLPRTSAVKMIDIWFIFTLFIPFLEVMLHTRMETIRHQLIDMVANKSGKSQAWDILDAKDQEKRKREMKKSLRTLQKIATLGLPLASILFLICFVLIGCLFASDNV